MQIRALLRQWKVYWESSAQGLSHGEKVEWFQVRDHLQGGEEATEKDKRTGLLPSNRAENKQGANCINFDDKKHKELGNIGRKHNRNLEMMLAPFPAQKHPDLNAPFPENSGIS